MVIKEYRKQFVSLLLDQAGQMCYVHLTRQVLKKVPKKKQKEVAEKIKEALLDRKKLNDLINELDSMGYKGAADTLESF